MKTAFVHFLEPNKKLDGEYLQSVSDLFINSGFAFSKIEFFSVEDDLGFRRAVERIKDAYDLLVVADNLKTTFSVKEIISDVLEKPLLENENAKRFLEAICKKNGAFVDYSHANLPIESTLIPNLDGVLQGFVQDDAEFTLCYLPKEFSELKVMAKEYLFPYLEKKMGINYNRLTLKYFGEQEKLVSLLESIKNDLSCEFDYSIEELSKDIKLELSFNGINSSNRAEVIRRLISSSKDEFYAEYDVSLSERLFDALKLKKLKLATAESFTAGNVVSSIIKFSGASEVIDEGIVCYSNESKMKRLGVKKESLVRNGAVSSVVAYEMALGLLSTGRCDVAIATTGIAGPNSDDTSKPVGLCYIAIGMKDGIHTYKYNFKGNREKVTNLAKNTATYLAIKKIKNL